MDKNQKNPSDEHTLDDAIYETSEFSMNKIEIFHKILKKNSIYLSTARDWSLSSDVDNFEWLQYNGCIIGKSKHWLCNAICKM